VNTATFLLTKFLPPLMFRQNFTIFKACTYCWKLLQVS